MPKQEIKSILTTLGFIQAKGQPNLYEKQIDDMEAYVDFRKKEFVEKGRRFVKKGDNFDIDPDTITDLVEFKRLRDEVLQSSSTEHSEKQPPQNPAIQVPPEDKLKLGTGDKLQLSSDNPDEDKNKREASTSGRLGQDNPIRPFSSPKGANTPPAPTSNKTVWDDLALAYEFDIVELFGNAGDGKSKFALKIAMDAIAQGKKVKYIDTERGFLRSEREKLGTGYQYISNMKGLMEYVKIIPSDIDLLIVDSVGYPVLTEWAKMGVNDRGNALTQLIAIKDLIKDWAINNNKIALVINQPDSDFGKAADYVNRPFGDKGQFVIKEVFRIERQRQTVTSKPMTKSLIKVFRSRYDARDTVVATVEISDEGVKIT